MIYCRIHKKFFPEDNFSDYQKKKESGNAICNECVKAKSKKYNDKIKAEKEKWKDYFRVI